MSVLRAVCLGAALAHVTIAFLAFSAPGIALHLAAALAWAILGRRADQAA